MGEDNGTWTKVVSSVGHLGWALRNAAHVLAPFPCCQCGAWIRLDPGFWGMAWQRGTLGNRTWTWPKRGNTGVWGPWRMNIASGVNSWFFAPSQCFVNVVNFTIATKCHVRTEDGVQNGFLMVFAGDCAPSHMYCKTDICFCSFFLILHVLIPWPKAEQVLVHIVLSFPIHIGSYYCYAWLNNCGLGRQLVGVFTRPNMNLLHHVQSLSVCCVPAIRLWLSFFLAICFISCRWTMRSLAAKGSTYVPRAHNVTSRTLLPTHPTPTPTVPTHEQRGPGVLHDNHPYSISRFYQIFT